MLALGALDVLARRNHQTVTDQPSDMKDVTFIVPAFDESETLPGTIASIRSELAAGARLIIVDDGSSDETFSVASALVNTIENGDVIHHQTNHGKAAALNSALAQVETAFIVTVDADTHLCDGAVLAALAALNASSERVIKTVAVAFDVAASPSERLFFELQRIEYDAALNFERRAQGVLGAISVCPGAASLWQAEALRDLGGFRDLTATEDVDATLRLAAKGLGTVHEPRARAITLLPSTFRQLMAQRRRWCLGHYQNIWVNRPRLSTPLRYAALTYLNFAALSFFLPLMLLATLAVIVFEPQIIRQQTLWFTNIIWIASAYGQRFFALTAIGQSARPLPFLLEPFFSTIVHFTAAASAVGFAIRQGIGGEISIWTDRAR